MRLTPLLTIFLCVAVLTSSIPARIFPERVVLGSPGRRHRLADAMATRAKASSVVLNRDTLQRLNTLVNLNVKYLETVASKVASGEMSEEQGQRIAGWITDTMKELEAKAQAYERAISQRERRRRRRGFFGFMNQLIKGGSRALGKVIGGVMYGTGRLLEYTIEEAAPKIIVDKVKALLRARIDELIKKLEGRIGPIGTEILVKVAKDLYRRRTTHQESPQGGTENPVPGQPPSESEEGEERIVMLNLTHDQVKGGVWIYTPFDDPNDQKTFTCLRGDGLQNITLNLLLDFDSGRATGTIGADGSRDYGGGSDRSFWHVEGSLAGPLTLEFDDNSEAWIWKYRGNVSYSADFKCEVPTLKGEELTWRAKTLHVEIDRPAVIDVFQEGVRFVMGRCRSGETCVELDSLGNGSSPSVPWGLIQCDVPSFPDTRLHITGPSVVDVESADATFSVRATGKDTDFVAKEADMKIGWSAEYLDTETGQWVGTAWSMQEWSSPLHVTANGPSQFVSLNYWKQLLEQYGRTEGGCKTLHMKVKAHVCGGATGADLVPVPEWTFELK